MRNRTKGKAVDVYGFPPNEITIKLNTADGKFSAEVKGAVYVADTLMEIKQTIKAVDEGVFLLQFQPYIFIKINDTSEVRSRYGSDAIGHSVELQYERMWLAFDEGRCFSVAYETPEAERPLKAKYDYSFSRVFKDGAQGGTIGSPEFLLPYSEQLWEQLNAKKQTLKLIGRDLRGDFSALAGFRLESDPETLHHAKPETEKVAGSPNV